MTSSLDSVDSNESADDAQVNIESGGGGRLLTSSNRENSLDLTDPDKLEDPHSTMLRPVFTRSGPSDDPDSPDSDLDEQFCELCSPRDDLDSQLPRIASSGGADKHLCELCSPRDDVDSSGDAGKYNGGEIFFDEFVVAVSAGFADLKDGSTSLSNGLARLAMAEKLAEATTTLIGRTFLVFFLCCKFASLNFTSGKQPTK